MDKFSIIELCEKGYKIRWTTENLKNVYEKYIELSSITKNKIIIQKNEKIISSEHLINLIKKNKKFISFEYLNLIKIQLVLILLIILYFYIYLNHLHFEN